MKTKQLITIISIFLAAFFLASCTSNKTIDNEKIITENLTIPNETGKVIPTQETKSIPQNFSVIAPNIKEGQEKEVKNEDYNLSKAITTKENCFDSDGGLIFNLKGYIKDTKETIFKDYCKDTTHLVEYKCGIIGYKEEIQTSCQYGCEDGACKNPREDQICKDSDGGKIYNTKGVVSYLGKNYTDYCKNENYVKEQYCTSLGASNEEEKLCVDGCIDGACFVKEINNKEGCTDSDFGINARYTKGTVTDTKGTVEDSCMNSQTVYEYKCNVVGFRMKENIFCPDGYKCEDGACVTA